VYRDECERLGKDPGPAPTSADSVLIALVHRDPDVGWKLIADACLHDMTTYADWIRDGSGASGPHFHVADAAALRASGRYGVLTPEQCIEQVRRTGVLTLDPLAGGIKPVVARASLDLIEHEVVPALRDLGALRVVTDSAP
jgi:hypothetical protein